MRTKLAQRRLRPPGGGESKNPQTSQKEICGVVPSGPGGSAEDGAQGQHADGSDDRGCRQGDDPGQGEDRKSTRLNSSHVAISYAVFCLKKKNWSCIVFVIYLRGCSYFSSYI